jgi:type VI secretion system ImpH/TssG family protein
VAGSDWHAPDHISFLRQAAPDAKLYSFFALLRQAEALAKLFPRIGRSRTIEDNIIDLAHLPALDFPSSTVGAIDVMPNGRVRASSLFFGLTGPMGPLPLHITEFAFFERRYSKKSPFADFLDVLSGRMMQFYYRAWADSQPAAQLDRPDDDQFGTYLSQISGAWDGCKDTKSPDKLARLHLIGLFASRRSPASIVDALELTLKSKVEIREFMARWRDVVAEDRTVLGASGRHNILGQSAMLGERVRVIQDTFQITVVAADKTELDALIPTGPLFAVARDLLDALSPSDTDWELQVQVPEAAISGVSLGGDARLGWSSWLTPKAHSTRSRRDTRLSRRWQPRLTKSGNDFENWKEKSYG